MSPEFIPPRQRTNPIKFSMERRDMMQRRKVLKIPEFYVGKTSSIHSSVLSSCDFDLVFKLNYSIYIMIPW